MLEVINFKRISREWLEYKKVSVKYSTYIKYKNVVYHYLDNMYEKKDIYQWNENDYYKWYKKLLEKELSKSMLRSIHYVLKDILIYGERVYHLKHTDLSYMKITGNKQKIRILSDNERDKLSNYCQDNINFTTLSIYMSMYTGMRIGEICGLKWKDIDLDNSIIMISRTVQRIEDDSFSYKKTKKMVFSPKTQSSKRIVVLTDFLVEYLNNYKKLMIPLSEDYFIISNSLEIPEVRNIQRNFKRICIKFDIDINFHSLRHSFATNCIKYNIDIKTLSELLGHSNISTTMNLYVHPSIDYKKEQIRKIPK